MRYLLLSLIFISCWSNPPADKSDMNKKEKVISSAAERSLRERHIIDSVANSWGWGEEMLSGGIRYAKYGQSSTSNSVDSIVFLDVYVDLLNGNKCYWLDSTAVKVGKYAGIRAVDELSKIIGEGDSVVALVPSDFGHGLSGLPGVVPPGAMLKVSVSQRFRQEAQ